MDFIRSKIAMIRKKLAARGLSDTRFIGSVFLAVIAVAVVWSGIGIVQKNYELLKKVAILEEENRILELENANKKLQNEYYATPEFAELKARRVNGRAAAGETVYIITDETALAHLKTPKQELAEQVTTREKPKYQQNFEAWMNFFFGG